MAKKKSASKPATVKRTAQPSVINLKGSDDYRAWLAGVSKKTHIASTVIVRLALAEWASKHGHAAPPEK
jgi:hypothetical protein